MQVTVRVRNASAYPLPQYQTAGSAGVDLYANLPQPQVLLPGERSLVPTGLFIELPAGWEAQIRPRSGLAWRYGVTILNTPGTIDADYRGEIQVILINLGQAPFTIEPGMRIAQMIFAPVGRVVWQVDVDLGASERGAGGFGHTGI